MTSPRGRARRDWIRVDPEARGLEACHRLGLAHADDFRDLAPGRVRRGGRRRGGGRGAGRGGRVRRRRRPVRDVEPHDRASLRLRALRGYLGDHEPRGLGRRDARDPRPEAERVELRRSLGLGQPDDPRNGHRVRAPLRDREDDERAFVRPSFGRGRLRENGVLRPPRPDRTRLSLQTGGLEARKGVRDREADDGGHADGHLPARADDRDAAAFVELRAGLGRLGHHLAGLCARANGRLDVGRIPVVAELADRLRRALADDVRDMRRVVVAGEQDRRRDQGRHDEEQQGEPGPDQRRPAPRRNRCFLGHLPSTPAHRLIIPRTSPVQSPALSS